MDFGSEYRVTIRCGTNWNSKWIYFIHCFIYPTPGRIWIKVAYYLVCIMFMLYICWKPSEMAENMVFMEIR